MSAVIVSAEKRAKIKKFSLPPFVHFNVHTGKHFSALQELLQIHNPHGSELERERDGDWRVRRANNRRKSLLFYFYSHSLAHSLFSPTYIHLCLSWSKSIEWKAENFYGKKWQLPELLCTVSCWQGVENLESYSKSFKNHSAVYLLLSCFIITTNCSNVPAKCLFFHLLAKNSSPIFHVDKDDDGGHSKFK